MKEKIIQLLLKYIPWLAKKIWPHLKKSLISNKTPNIVAFRDDSTNNNVILFVHGFSGEAETTFGNIPDYLKTDANINGWNMYSVGYSSDAMPSLGIGIWAAIPDITKVANFLDTEIKNHFRQYNQIAIVAHSMGGLVTQQAILQLEPNHRNRISHVMLFGTPSKGLVKAKLARWWNRQLRDMSWNGKFITELRSSWVKTFPNNYPFTFKVVAGTDDEFVPVESSQEPFNYDRRYCEVVSGNHLTIVKPENKNHAGYQLILATLTNIAFNNIYTDKEEVNILLGNYNQVVNDLMQNKNNLDKRGVAKLVFALEGLGRSQEAIEIMEQSSVTPNNSDLLGILGGRYKRRYLEKSFAADATTAIDYYKKGLAIATEKSDNEQIYYHAINLAFMYLVNAEDKTAMAAYAEQALTAAKACADDCWKFATIAEANIYLGSIDTARENYTKAITFSACGLREKTSMYTNAFIGYTTLKHIESGTDSFIEFLKNTLLRKP